MSQEPVRPVEPPTCSPTSLNEAKDLFCDTAAKAKNLGFPLCAYGIRLPLPISQPTFLFFDNYGGEAASYVSSREAGDERNRALINRLQSALQAAWESEVYDLEHPSSRAASPGWETAVTHEVRHAGGSVGLLVLERDATTKDVQPTEADKAGIGELAHSLHCAMAKLFVPRYTPEIYAVITAREKEVLRWTAEGKTAGEIAQIIRVSERTVNFHLTNAVKKLKAANKTQAAVKAATLGMLF